MTRYNQVKDSHMTIATGDDSGAGSGLTEWDNAHVKFAVGELNSIDKLLGWSLTPPVKETQEQGVMTSSRVSGRYSKSRKIGMWKSKHAFQTVQFCYWLMQTTGLPTTEGTPVSYNTHALTIGATNIPDWHGIHFEREGIGSNELRYDLMGFCPSDLVIDCGQDKEAWKATQEITIPHTFVNTAADNLDTSALTRPVGTIGTLWKDWAHLIAGAGAGKDVQGLTYNGSPLEVDVKHVSIRLHRDYFIGGIPDTSGYFQYGLMSILKYSYVLEVFPIGDLLYTVNQTAKEDYAGDLDYDFKFDADATNDNSRFLTDKLYLVPFDEINDWNQYTESYQITLEPLDETSSLTITGIDGLDNTHFENP